MNNVVRPPMPNSSTFGLMRPQFKVPQPPPPVETTLNTTRGTAPTQPVRSSQLVRDTHESRYTRSLVTFSVLFFFN